ncbi:MAG: hypothetical protein K2Q04_08365 [Hyphomicrobium sp.]|nr:hypothetical protein [Hyphomicrobium sp.]
MRRSRGRPAAVAHGHGYSDGMAAAQQVMLDVAQRHPWDAVDGEAPLIGLSNALHQVVITQVGEVDGLVVAGLARHRDGATRPTPLRKPHP